MFFGDVLDGFYRARNVGALEVFVGDVFGGVFDGLLHSNLRRGRLAGANEVPL